LSHPEVICGPLKDPVWGTPEGGLRREDAWQRWNWRRVTDHRKRVIKSGNQRLMWKKARIHQDHRTWPKVQLLFVGWSLWAWSAGVEYIAL